MAIDRAYYEKRIADAEAQLVKLKADLPYIKQHLPTSVYPGRLREIKKCEARIVAFKEYLK